jgi:hypothetical protein
MAFKEDIKIVLNQIGTNLVGNLKEEYGVAVMEAHSVGSFQPLVKFYNDNEQELETNYGISLNDLIGLSEDAQNSLTNYGEPIPLTSEPSYSEKVERIMKELVLPILGIIAGGTAVLILIKTLKK